MENKVYDPLKLSEGVGSKRDWWALGGLAAIVLTSATMWAGIIMTAARVLAACRGGR